MTPLEYLLDTQSKHQVLAVYTQPDRPAGRGRKLQQSAVKKFALDRGLAVQQPENFKKPIALTRLSEYQADLMVVVAYGLILPKAVLNLPAKGAINIHASLLPRWRGAAPIHRAIMAGDQETGVSIMQMDEGLDTGDILLQKSLVIEAEETCGSLHDKLSTLGAELLMQTLDDMQAGSLRAHPQEDEKSVYAAKVTKAEANLDWSEPAELLERKIRAFNPFPVAWTSVKGQRMQIWRAAAGFGGKPIGRVGEILPIQGDRVFVQTGGGVLALIEVQLEGGRRMKIKELLNSHRLLPGTLLGPVKA